MSAAESLVVSAVRKGIRKAFGSNPAERSLREALIESCRPTVAQVAKARGVTPGGIWGNRRMAYLTKARHEAWATLWLGGMTYLGIAHAFGVHHTTVLHGVRKCLGEEKWQFARRGPGRSPA